MSVKRFSLVKDELKFAKTQMDSVLQNAVRRLYRAVAFRSTEQRLFDSRLFEIVQGKANHSWPDPFVGERPASPNSYAALYYSHTIVYKGIHLCVGPSLVRLPPLSTDRIRCM